MGKKYVDYDTGEIIDNVTRIVTEDQQRKASEYKIHQKKKQHLYKLMNKHCGNFYFYRYDKLLEQLDDDTATAFRFLYLCACADNEGYMIAYDNVYCDTVEDFTYVFERTKDTVRKYVEDLKRNKLLYKDEKGYRLNPIFYSSGSLDNNFKRNSIRTFNNAIKELYRNSNPKEHKLIGKLLKLVPYINIYNNVLCWNIEDTNKETIQPLTIEEIRYIIHPQNNYNYSASDRLENIFIKGEPVMGRFRSVGQEQFIINPRLFYRGNDSKDLQAIIDQFDIAKQQYIKKRKRKPMNKGGN